MLWPDLADAALSPDLFDALLFPELCLVLWPDLAEAVLNADLFEAAVEARVDFPLLPEALLEALLDFPLLFEARLEARLDFPLFFDPALDARLFSLPDLKNICVQLWCKIDLLRAVAVAQLLEQSLPTPEIRDSNTAMSKFYIERIFAVNQN